MSTRPWMPLYVADYLADTGELSTIEHGAYLLLIMHYWANGSLPNDDAKLKNIAKMSSHNWKKSRETLQKKFDAGWKHKRIEQELEKVRSISEKRSKAAQKRYGENDANAPANAERKQTHSQPQSQSPKKEDSLAHSRSELFEKPFAEQKPDGWPKDFRDQFWNEYPKKVGKKAAIKTLERVRKSGEVSFEKLMAGVQRYRSERPPGVAEQQYTCAAQRWLNEGRWDDEPANETRKQTNGYQRRPDGAEAITAGVRAATDKILGRDRGGTDFAEGFDPERSGPGAHSASDLELPYRVVGAGSRS